MKELQAALIHVADKFSVLQIRHFLPNIQSEIKKKGEDAIEGVLLDI